MNIVGCILRHIHTSTQPVLSSHDHKEHALPEVPVQPIKKDTDGQAVEVDVNNFPDVGVEILPDNLQGDDYTFEQLQTLMGMTLVIGFIFMLIIDQCGGGHSHTHSPGR